MESRHFEPDVPPRLGEVVRVGVPVLLAAQGVQEEVEGVLDPVDAIEEEAERGVVALRVRVGHDGDRGDEDGVAEGDQDHQPGRLQLNALDLPPELGGHPVGGEMTQESQQCF